MKAEELIIFIKTITYLVVVFSIVYGVRRMILINTNYKYHFGMGICIFVNLFLSLFKYSWWLNCITSLIMCVILYFLIKIIEEK